MNANECYEVSLIERFLAGKAVIESNKSEKWIARFRDAEWISLTSRNKAWRLKPEFHDSIYKRLRQLWPTREDDLVLLKNAGLNAENPSSLLHLPSLRRALSSVSGYINAHTWSTLFGYGPKKSSWRSPDADVVLTQDTNTRIRPNKGLELNRDGKILNVDDIASVLGEIGIPQRAILSGTQFSGTLPSIVITVENLGAFVDACVPENVMLVYSPGFDISAAGQVLKLLPGVPWMHFGDLDPEGLQIWAVLQNEVRRQCSYLVPSFAHEYIDMAQKPDVAWENAPVNSVFNELKRTGKGIFQEVFVLDERLNGEFAAFAEGKNHLPS